MGAKIAKSLPGPHQRGDGFISTGAGTVTWAIGHLFEQAAPEDYDPKYKSWNYGDLPIIPSQWKIQITNGKSKQAAVIKNLLKTCSEVVNAGDPGREGQLIVDEILEYFNNKKPVYRLLLNSLDAPSIKKALANLQPNSQFQNLYEAALGRQRADWTVGMNLTRAYTILGRQKGYQGVLSVGRVQTPTLAIVVRREEEIENFVPQKYFNIHCQIGSTPPFRAKYVPPKQYTSDPPTSPKPAWLDEMFRVCDETQAKKIVADVAPGTPAKVTGYSNVPAVEQPPLPFKLSGVQSKMNAKSGVGVQEVLEGCQSLYEKGYASYPRTDCVYLPTTQLPEAPGVLQSIAKAMPQLAALTAQADTSLISPAWNDSKLGEHHAIIPTATSPDMSTLSPLERDIYEAICKRYLAQFLPPCEVDKATIEIEAGGHEWIARGRVIRVPGWRVVYGAEPDDDEDEKDGKEEDSEDGTLPVLKVGDVHPVASASSTEKTTTPPPRYTEGTLIKAMEHIHRLVSDPAEKKMLKMVEGIGRAATRANIIGTLIKRGFVEVKKKQLHPSPTARVLVKAVDKDLSDPGLTARWEQVLDGVAAGKITLQAFQQKQEQWVKQLVNNASSVVLPQAAPAAAGASSGPSKSYSKSTSGAGAKKSGGGKSAGATGKACPKCGKAMAERTVKNGPKAGTKFLGCTGFPACNHSEWPK